MSFKSATRTFRAMLNKDKQQRLENYRGNLSLPLRKQLLTADDDERHRMLTELEQQQVLSKQSSESIHWAHLFAKLPSGILKPILQFFLTNPGR